ncbi:MAG: LysR substrate-binding domain-containing protein [Pseudomonadota bacterium]
MDLDAPSRPTLRQLQCFVAVAEHQAFGEAANALAMSQPALSKQIAVMEEELGVTLFERTSRRVSLTALGDALVVRARAILQEMREFRAIAQGSLGLFGDRLAIGVLPSIGAYFMPIANRLLHRLYPNLRLAVHEGSTRQLLAMLEDGRLDVVIGTPQTDPDFISHPLFSETLWACAAADDPLSQETGPITLSDLANNPLITVSPNFQLADIVERLAEIAGTHMSRDYQGATLDAARQMAVMGAGVAVLPSLYALAEAVRDPEFVVRRIEHPLAKHDIALLWRKSTPREPDCLQLAEHLISVKQDIRAARAEPFR